MHLLVIGAALKGASILLGLVQGIVAVAGVIAGIGLGPLLLIIGALVGGALLIIKYWDRNQSVLFGILGRVLRTKTDDDKRCVWHALKDEIMRELVDAFRAIQRLKRKMLKTFQRRCRQCSIGRIFRSLHLRYTSTGRTSPAMLNGLGDLIRFGTWRCGQY